MNLSPATILAVAATVCFAVPCACAWYWSRSIAKLDQEMKSAEAEHARLGNVQAQNRQYEQQLRELEQRIRTIQALEDNRAGPADFMTALGDTVNRASNLYLLSVTPGGDRVSIKGEAGSETGIAGFIAALKRYGSFGDVQLQQYYQDDEAKRKNFKFDLNCLYKRAPPGNEPAPGSAISVVAARK